MHNAQDTLAEIRSLIITLKKILASKEILGRFTTQKDGLIYRKFQDASFRKNHPEAVWFFKAFDYTNADYLSFVQQQSLNWDVFVQARAMMNNYLMRQLSAVSLGLDLDFLIVLSGEVQEQRSAENLSICFLPSKERFYQNRSQIMIAFAEDDEKGLCHDLVHAVRKQLNLAKECGLAVYRDVENCVLRTVGILNKNVVCSYPRIVLKKHMEWEFHVPSRRKGQSCMLRYKQGTFMMPLLNMSVEHRNNIYKKLHSMNYNNANRAAATIAALFPAIEACDHGAVVIFLEESVAANEAYRLISAGRGFLLPKKKQLLRRGKPNVMLIKQMASIDGAILADFNGNCHAYGVILDGVASSPGAGSKDRGARYNSTKTYLDSVTDCCKPQNEQGIISRPARIGIVRSEDGLLDVFP